MDIELRNVWYTYDRVNYVLRDVSLKLSSGLQVIVGPNGSGKTTLLKIASLMYKPNKGTVVVDNSDYWSLNADDMLRIRRNIVYVHERALLIRGSVKTNLELGLRLRGIDSGDALEYFIDRYGISSIVERDAKKLSTGQAKLVSIIRALAVKPKALLLDEPLSHIDADKTSLLIEDLIKLSRYGSTVVLATHYIVPELQDALDNMYEIVNGVVRRKHS